MRLSLDQGIGIYQIQGFEPGTITINKETYSKSLIIAPEVLLDWRPQTFSDLQAEDMIPILELGPEVVILGTGQQQKFPHPSFLTPFFDQAIGVEVMDTRAACHTYNVLMSESRKVVAGLLIF